jgi:integrase/ribosomal protein L40E
MVCMKCKAALPDDAVFCMRCGKKQMHETQPRSKRTRPNGAGSAYKRGKTWTAAIVVGWRSEERGGKPHWTPDRRTKGGFATKTSALEYCQTLWKDFERESHRLHDDVTFEEYWQMWRNSYVEKLAKETRVAYDIAHKKLSGIMSRPVKSVSVADLQEAIDKKAKTFYPAKDMRSVLNALYELAIADEVVSVVRSKYVMLPDLKEDETEPFNIEEVRAIWADYHAGNVDSSGYILVMLYAGMMPGELFIFKKSMIDWETRQIVNCGLKTSERRSKPMVIAEAIVPVLQKLCALTGGDKVLNCSEETFRKRFRQALARCGCRDTLRPYSCRHTPSTILSVGVKESESVIRSVMRQKHVKNARRYMHPSTQDALIAVNKMADYVDGEKDKR